MVTVTVRSVANMRAELAEAEPALAERDRGADQRDAGRRAHLRADEDGDRQLRAPVGADGREPVTDQRGQADRERELAEVEEELDRRQPAVEQQRQRGSDDGGDHEVAAGREHEAEHERDVAERERVGVAAELQVDDAALADQEAERQPPPGDVRLVQRRQAGDGPGEERDGGGPDREVEPPHGVHASRARHGCPAGCCARRRRSNWSPFPWVGLIPSIGTPRQRLSAAQESGARARMFRRT